MKKLIFFSTFLIFTTFTQLLLCIESITFERKVLEIINYPLGKIIEYASFTHADIRNKETLINKKLRDFDREQRSAYKKPAHVYTASIKCPDLTEAYLVLGVDPNEEAIEPHCHATPLISAADWGCFHSAALLLAYGADAALENTHHYTPLTSTRFRNNYTIKQLIIWWLRLHKNSAASERIASYKKWLKDKDNRKLLEYWLYTYDYESIDTVSKLVDWWTLLQSYQESTINLKSYWDWMGDRKNMELLLEKASAEELSLETVPYTWELVDTFTFNGYRAFAKIKNCHEAAEDAVIW